MYLTKRLQQANADYGSEDILLMARSLISGVALKESSVEEGKDRADNMVKEL